MVSASVVLPHPWDAEQDDVLDVLGIEDFHGS
jgi:hypothetical protein